MTENADITILLKQAHDGEPGALDRLMQAVYHELEGIASGKMRAQFGGNLAGVTLEPSALVNEAFIRLRDRRYEFGNRHEYFGLATKVMLNVLHDYRRGKSRQKRGGDQVRVELTDIPGCPPTLPQDLAMALEKLEGLHSRHAAVVNLRAIWGFKIAEVAEALKVSEKTVERDWRFARNWLADELKVS